MLSKLPKKCHQSRKPSNMSRPGLSPPYRTGGRYTTSNSNVVLKKVDFKLINTRVEKPPAPCLSHSSRLTKPYDSEGNFVL